MTCILINYGLRWWPLWSTDNTSTYDFRAPMLASGDQTAVFSLAGYLELSQIQG
jgi:hypothetical protein